MTEAEKFSNAGARPCATRLASQVILVPDTEPYGSVF